MVPVWRNIGPGGGGWIESICASPHDVNELFVGCDVGGFYRSTDGGASYHIWNDGLQDYFVERIVPHPRNANIIYLGCQSGVYKSTDRGRSWRWLRSGFPPKRRYSWSAPISALVIDEKNPNVLYAGIGRPRFHREGKGTIYKTTDGGNHWFIVNEPGSLPKDALISDLLIDPKSSAHLYLACQYGVYQSRDAGKTWARTSDGLLQPWARRLSLCKSVPRVIYVTLYSPPGKKPWRGGVYKSTDGGQHWAPCNDGLNQAVGKPGQPGPMTANYDWVVVHPDNPDIVYVGGISWVNATIYKSTNGGKSWREITRRGKDSNMDMGWITMWGPTVKCLSMSPLNPDVLYFGTSGQVFKTLDGGEHWSQIYTRMEPDGRFGGTGLEVTCLHNIVIHPKDPRRLYFGYYDIGLLISEDGGRTFRRCVEGIAPRGLENSCFAVAFDPDDPSHCWGSFGAWGSNKGLIAESKDGGLTWKVVGTPETGLPNARHRQLIVDPRSSKNARRVFTTADGHGIFVSDDGGHTWHARNEGLPSGEVRGLVMHPSKPDILWCALAGKKKSGAIYRTKNAGKTWSKISENLEPADIRRLVITPSQPDRLYLAARDVWTGKEVLRGGVYRSDDGGRTWRCILRDDFVQGLAVHPKNPDIVFAGLTDHPYHDECTGDGIVMTTDGGKTWRSINGVGLSCKHVNVITIDPHDPHRLYLGTGGNGVFVGQVSW